MKIVIVPSNFQHIAATYTSTRSLKNHIRLSTDNKSLLLQGRMQTWHHTPHKWDPRDLAEFLVRRQSITVELSRDNICATWERLVFIYYFCVGVEFCTGGPCALCFDDIVLLLSAPDFGGNCPGNGGGGCEGQTFGTPLGMMLPCDCWCW